MATIAVRPENPEAVIPMERKGTAKVKPMETIQKRNPYKKSPCINDFAGCEF